MGLAVKGSCVGVVEVAIDVDAIVGILVAGTNVDGDCDFAGLCVDGG